MIISVSATFTNLLYMFISALFSLPFDTLGGLA
jgi:hypothetical protein